MFWFLVVQQRGAVEFRNVAVMITSLGCMLGIWASSPRKGGSVILEEAITRLVMADEVLGELLTSAESDSPQKHCIDRITLRPPCYWGTFLFSAKTGLKQETIRSCNLPRNYSFNNSKPIECCSAEPRIKAGFRAFESIMVSLKWTTSK